MIRFEGNETFQHLPSQVFPLIANAGWLARALPDVEIIEANDDRASWRVKPKFAFMAGTLDTVAEVQDRSPDQQVRYRVTSKGVGSQSTVEAVLTFESIAEGTTSIRWTADLTELGGLLKMVPRGLIQAAAQKVITDVWASVQARVNESPR